MFSRVIKFRMKANDRDLVECMTCLIRNYMLSLLKFNYILNSDFY